MKMFRKLFSCDERALRKSRNEHIIYHRHINFRTSTLTQMSDDRKISQWLFFSKITFCFEPSFIE